MTFPVSDPVPEGAARCLVVDDEPGVRRALTRLFRQQGFACLEAGTGQEALDLLASTGEVPLIVSDMRMPELDGMGLLQEAHAVQLGHSDRKSTRLNSSHVKISYAVFCLKKKKGSAEDG